MTDSESSKNNDKILQECSLSDENERNGGNNDADGEDIDAESGIGTLNEYDIVVNVESTEVGNSSRNGNETNASDYGEGIRSGFAKEMNREKVSVNMERKSSRRYTEGDVRNQSSERNTSLRRHTFASSRDSNVDEDDYQPETRASRLSSEEKKQGKASMNSQLKGSRRHTESDLLDQSSERNTSLRRHTFAGSRCGNVDEDDYQPESNSSRFVREEMKRRRGSINSPKGSRRHTESDVRNQTSGRNAGHRRYTFAGSRLDNIEEDDFQAATNTSRLSKSFSDTGIHAARDFDEGDNSFRPQNYNISRRNTVAGDIVEGLRELLGKSVEGDNGNTSRLSNKGKRHTVANIHVPGNPDVPLRDDIRDPKPETSNDDDISTSEDEQNMRRTREQYESFKRHTIAGDWSEYNQGRMQSRGWFTSDEPDTRINPDNRQPPKSAVLKRHTIAGTTRQDMDTLIDGDELRSLQLLARSSQGRKYSADTRQPRRTSTIHRGNVDETQGDGLPDNIPTPLKRHSASGQEYIRDVILDKDEDIRIDRLPLGSSLSRRHTVHSGRQDVQLGATAVDPVPQTKRRGTHAGFTQVHEFTLHGGLKDEQLHSRRESGPVGRGKTESDVGYGVDELPLNREKQQDYNVDQVDSTIHPVYGHPFENRDSLDAEEDGLGQNFEGIERPVERNENCDIYPGEDRQKEKYYVYSDHEIDRNYVPRTPRNSSRYILSDNELHIHEDDAPRGTNIIVEDTNPTNSMKIQTPRFTITRSGQNEIQHHGQKRLVYHASEMDQTHGETRVQHEEVVTSQQSKDLNTGTVSFNYFVLRRSVAPSPERKMNETGPQSGVQMIPARNILLRGQDDQGNKLKFNLSVIEEEGDEEYYREMEIQSQETSDNRVSAQQFVHICNQKPVAMTKNEGPPNHITIGNMQNFKKDGSGTKDKRQVVDSNNENNPCQRSCSKPHTSAEATSGEGNEMVSQKTQQNENDKSVEISEKTDRMKADEKSAISKSSKSHRKKFDSRSHKTDGNLPLPCCSLHGKYQLHHPICCWHMTNNQCDECKAKQSRKSEPAESDVKSGDFSRETSQTSESLAEETGQKFRDPAQETKYISKSEQQKACPNCIHDLQETRQKNDSKADEVCPKCGGGLQIATGGKNETKTGNSENFQGTLEDSRPKRDTSSERGEYKTAQETSISEDDFNDIKLYSDEGSSSVRRTKRRHRKSYKGKSRRKGSLERRRGSPIRLSPIKTAAYDRIVKQNKEMSDYLAKLTDEKSELRSTLCHLELQISQYRDREANHFEGMRRNKNEMEAILTTERTRAAQDCRTLHQTVEGQKRKLNELQDKLREREIEVDETKHSLQIMEDQVEIYKASAKRLQSSESFVPHWTPTRIQKLYTRYIRAEKSRKSLVYQKKYLVLLLGGFRENETRTLALIAKMGAYPSYHEPTSRFSPAFTKFRTAVRVVVATKRMQFLVAKSKKSIKQVMEPVDSKSSSHRNTQSSSKSVNNDRQYDLSRPNYRQSNAYQSVPSRFESDDLNGYSSHPSDISTDPKDASFAEIYTGSIDTAVPKHTHDSGVYSAFDYKPTEMVTRGTSRDQPNSDLTNRLESHNVHSMSHSPPVRERPNSQGSRHSSIRPPFSAYPYQTDPRRNARTSLHFDSEDLDRKIQTLDNLQQKLSLNRGTKDRDR